MADLIKHLAFALIIALATACSDSTQFSTTEVSGRVINGLTEDVFTRGTVTLVESKTTREVYAHAEETTLDEQEIGADGSYAFEFNAKRGSRYSYIIRYQYPDGEVFAIPSYTGGLSVTFHHLEKKEEQTARDFRIFPAALLTVHAFNENEVDENDEIEVFVNHPIVGRIGAGSYIGGGGLANEEHNERYEVNAHVAGTSTMEWNVTRNGLTQSFSEVLELEHNVAHTFEIRY